MLNKLVEEFKYMVMGDNEHVKIDHGVAKYVREYVYIGVATTNDDRGIKHDEIIGKLDPILWKLLQIKKLKPYSKALLQMSTSTSL